MITSAESLAHLAIAAGISTAMVGRALVGRPPRAGERRCRVRWLWLAAGALGAVISCGVALADTQVGRDVDARRILSAFVALAIGTLVAVSFALAGLRGRRVGDHPHCRRCRFDLFGRPDGSLVCNECGAPLDGPRAIVVGTRQRRVGPLLIGVFTGIVVLAYATSLAPEVARWARMTDFSSVKPDAWLIADLWDRNAQTNGRAGNELSNRATLGTLDHATLDRLVARLLVQPLPRPRMPGVDQNAAFAAYLAEQAWPRGTADEATVRRAMQASLACTLVVAPQASAGRTLRYWISIADYRAARDDADDPTMARVTVSNRVDALDGVPLPAPTWSALRGDGEWPGLEPFGNAFDLRGRATTLGPATLTTTCTATLTLAVPGRPTLVESRGVTLTGTTTLVDAASMACPPAFATTRRGATAPASTQPLATRASLSIGGTYGPPRTMTLAIQAHDATLLADVILHAADGRSRPLGTVFADDGGEASVPLDPEPTGDFTIELRPVPERGADLFRPPPVFVAPTTIPSSAIEGRANPN